MRPVRPIVSSAAVAAACVFAATLLRVLLGPIVGDDIPYITLLLGVALAASYGGSSAGFIAIALSCLSAGIFILPPSDSWLPSNGAQWVGMVVFIVVSSIVSLLAERTLRRGRQLNEEHERFQTTLASVGDGVIVTDTQGRVRFMNTVAENLCGWTLKDAEGEPLHRVFRIINEESRQPVESPVDKALREGRIVELANHTILLSRSGAEFAIDDSAAPIRDEVQQLIGVVLVFRDVTAQRESRRALEKSEFLFRTLADSAPALVWMTGPDGLCEFVNRPWIEFTGRPVSQELQHGWLSRIHPDDAERSIQILKHAFETRVDARLEFRYLRRDGEYRWLLTRGQPYFNSEGDYLGFIGSCLDISEKHQAEIEVRENEDLLRAVFESSNVGIILNDPVTGRFLRVNDKFCEITGYSAAELADRTFLEIVDVSDHESIREIFSRLLAGTISEYSVEKRYLRKNGEIFWTRVNSVMLRNPDGSPRYKLAVIEEIQARKRAEFALRESEERFRMLATNAPAAIFVKDAEGKYTVANPPTAEALGHPEGVVGKTDYELLPAELADTLRSHDLQVMATGEIWSGEDVIGPPGAERYFHTVKYPALDLSGERVGVYGIAVDVTERKRAEQLLQQSEEQFRLLANSIPQLAWMADADGNPFWYNQRWCDYTGLTAAEMQRTDWESVHDPAELPRVQNSWQNAVAEGESWEDLYPLLRHDGVYRWHLAQAVPLRDADGRIQRWFGTNTDITQSRQTEAMLRFLADASHALAALVDDRSALQKMAHLAVPNFADWCTVDMFGSDGDLQRVAIAHAEEEAMHWALDLRDHRKPRATDPFGAGVVLSTGGPVLIPEITDAMLETFAEGDAALLAKLKELRLKSTISVPLTAHDQQYGILSFATAESGRVFGSEELQVAMDLAHRATIAIENSRLYDRIREADTRKNEFLAMLSHELRNPLAPIRSGLDVLAIEKQGDPEMLHVMQQQVDHLVRLVDDLLDVTRIIRGRIELKQEPVELSQLVHRAVNTMRTMLETQGQAVSIELPSTPVWLYADPVRLVQVIENLLSNAAKYSEHGTSIQIIAESVGHWVKITVRDHGIGIEQELLPRVFDLFTQATRSLDRSQGGLGIGLTLVKRLIEMHGGSVSVHSQGVGMGSEFIVKLPTTELQQEPDMDDTPDTGHRKLKILVVDDNIGNSRIVSGLLCKLGDHEIQTAHDGQTALERVAAWRPDLVLLDIGLPGIDGYEVGRRIRQDSSNDALLLVALTGYGQEDDRRRSRSMGFDEHLVKPISLAELQRVLTHSKLRRKSSPRPPSESSG
ncbi:PAS domain S-box protein [Planctomicrobium sp. SH664]|uniref:PAS domain S-box protein n=1 Tax=Planctomicrobium sp. SH664 TaxID=3448125 RepID=UPI003F5C4675